MSEHTAKYWKKKFQDLNRELMAELRDPCGTIWEHAQKQQDKIAELKGRLQEIQMKMECADIDETNFQLCWDGLAKDIEEVV